MDAEMEELKRRVGELEGALKGQAGDWLKELDRRIAKLEKDVERKVPDWAVTQIQRDLKSVEGKLQKLADLVYQCAQKIDPGLAQEVKREFP